MLVSLLCASGWYESASADVKPPLYSPPLHQHSFPIAGGERISFLPEISFNHAEILDYLKSSFREVGEMVKT